MYLLCNIDLQWQPDPQREHPGLRDYFFNLFKNELISRKFNFDIVSGQGTERLKYSIRIIDKFIKNNNDFANTN